MKQGSPLAERLAHVLWLGGGACAGKSSVAVRLAERHGLCRMPVDALFEDHRDRSHPHRHADFRRLARRPFRDLWADDADPYAELVAYYESQFGLLIEDVLDRSTARSVLVEGAGLLPARVAPLLLAPRQAVWIFCSAAARRRRHVERAARLSHLLLTCADPARAQRRWLRRDDRYARHLERQAGRHGLSAVRLDDDASVDDVVGRVGRLFGLA